MSLPNKVHLLEVSPRDGLQNEKQFVASDIKIAFINHLSETGLQAIEVTSFVSPKQIPQLADHEEVFQHIQKYKGIEYSALIPNTQGLQKALKKHIASIAVFSAASETFCQKNINCSIQESLKRLSEVIILAKQHKLHIRTYISCAVYCPYEGYIDANQVSTIAQQFYHLGCDEICLGFTMGKANIKETQQLLENVTKNIPTDAIALHFHDTYGQALANIYASLQYGIHRFDCAVAGLGGCPSAKGAGGNVASEDLVYLLEGLGISTGKDLEKLIEAGHFICHYLKRPNQSKIGCALRKQ